MGEVVDWPQGRASVRVEVGGEGASWRKPHYHRRAKLDYNLATLAARCTRSLDSSHVLGHEGSNDMDAVSVLAQPLLAAPARPKRSDLVLLAHTSFPLAAHPSRLLRSCRSSFR